MGENLSSGGFLVSLAASKRLLSRAMGEAGFMALSNLGDRLLRPLRAGPLVSLAMPQQWMRHAGG